LARHPQVGGVVRCSIRHLGRTFTRALHRPRRAKHIIAAAELVEVLTHALGPARVDHWCTGPTADGLPRIDREIERYAGGALCSAERRPLTIEDRAALHLHLGHDRLAKAAKVSHARLNAVESLVLWVDGPRVHRQDVHCLPIVPSVGGVLATGAGAGRRRCGGAVGALLPRGFWSDVTARGLHPLPSTSESCAR